MHTPPLPSTHLHCHPHTSTTMHTCSFIEWMYPSGGGDENVESAALGILILWTTWFAFNAGSAESISGMYKQHYVVASESDIGGTCTFSFLFLPSIPFSSLFPSLLLSPLSSLRQGHPCSCGSYCPHHVSVMCLSWYLPNHNLWSGADLQEGRDFQCQRDSQWRAGLTSCCHGVLPLHRPTLGYSHWK